MSTNNRRRYNPLLDEWVIVAANRVNRPWQGATVDDVAAQNQKAAGDVVNPLAPGGTRANQKQTPNYEATYVFENDFPSFTEFDQPTSTTDRCEDDDELFKSEEVRGVCRVICYHPDSNLNLATMSIESVTEVVKLWRAQYVDLQDKYTWVQIFENRGTAVGCSNLHPHGQLWASNFLPTLAGKKDQTQKAYLDSRGKVMLVEYLRREVEKNERIVLRNQHWTVLVPFWAFWPFETLLLPNRHVCRFTDLGEDEQASLAEILQKLLIKYDNIFKCSFPFSMGWLGAPTGENLAKNCQHWQLHASFHPPLLRSATVQKYMAGYEVFAEKQRDITPEAASKIIRDQSEVHYSLNL